MGIVNQHNATQDWPAVSVVGPDGPADFVLVCEHASANIPAGLNDLGLSENARFSHAAWDIGARDMALRLSETLNAPLVLGGISRLVYDCNRPFSAPDCIPARSEAFKIPGNAELSPEARQFRFDRVHKPFHDQVAETVNAAGPNTCLVTLHSFTPVYNNSPRDAEIGYLYHADARLAYAALAQHTGGMRAALNEPYSATDGVTYTLQKHGEAHDIPALMVEVRNDLIDTQETARDVADMLAATLMVARSRVVAR
jgi:predicted N-formylglutamate amidohydrolase